MSAAAEIYRRLSPLLALALLPLALLLVLQKGETQHWHKQSDQYEKLYRGEVVAHAVTVANYRAAAEQARAADRANVERVRAEQVNINQERSNAFESRLADARATAERLRRSLVQASAHPGSPGATPVPGVQPPAAGAAEAARQDGLSLDDRLVATEQAIQLDELIKWVKRTAGIDMSGRQHSR